MCNWGYHKLCHDTQPQDLVGVQTGMANEETGETGHMGWCLGECMNLTQPAYQGRCEWKIEIHRNDDAMER